MKCLKLKLQGRAVENFVVGGGKILPGTMDKQPCNSCMKESPRISHWGREGHNLNSVQIAEHLISA